MLNIEVQSCGLALVLLLIFFSTRHERLGLYAERLFRVSLYANLTCIVLDILSILGIVYSSSLPQIVTVILCKLYLASLVTVSYLGFVYAYSDVKKLRENKILQIVQTLLLMLGVSLIMILPIDYYCEGRIVYSFGPATGCTYIFAPIFIFGALTVSYVYGKQINPHRRRAVRAWMFLELGAAGVQFIKPELLLVGFGSAAGMMILYAELENPDAILDRVTGTFSYRILTDYLQQLYDNKKSFSCIFICSESEWKQDIETETKILIGMAEYLHKFANTKLFRSIGNDYILVYSDSMSDDNLIRRKLDLKIMEERFKGSWAEGVVIETSLMYLPDGGIAESAEDLISLYQYFRSEIDESLKETIILNDKSVEKIKEYKTVLKEIMQAISDDRVEVFYQPIYSFEKDSFVSAEALARIRDGSGNIMMPARFIPVAEESGMIAQLGERVFEKTCLAIKNHELEDSGLSYIEVNLSVAQCENSEFSDIYSNIIRKHHIPFDKVNFEITESSILNMRAILLENMRTLKEAGCTFSLDDFGVGESNLNYIVDMPVDIVKFDKSLVMKYFTNEKARVVMTNTVNMVKKLGYKTIAEGVEEYDQLMCMKEIGIDYIQGFYFSRPLPYMDFVRFISENNKSPVLGGRTL
ncbi:MAG: EAL domain-containing protein [Lachnospiraceae bacterium]|nr:EAL domain-containing protein [Lachnospiraceae bacterium]